MDIDGLKIDPGELTARRYGPSTAAGVLAYKKKRKIVNRSYQSTEDDVVGKMTIASLDKEMADRQYVPPPAPNKICDRASLAVPTRPRGRFGVSSPTRG